MEMDSEYPGFSSGQKSLQKVGGAPTMADKVWAPSGCAAFSDA